MKGFFLLLVACSLSSCNSQQTKGCPADDVFAPCICRRTGNWHQLNIDCSNATSVEQLVDSFNVDFQYTLFAELTIEGGPLWYLPVDAFRPIKFWDIYIQGNAKLIYVEEDTFGGTENYIRHLFMEENAIEGVDIFGAITKMKKLLHVTLNSNRLTSVPERAFADLPEVVSIDLGNNLISKLGREAFLDCPKLRDVYLHNNRLTVVPGRVIAFGKSVPDDTRKVLLDLHNNQIDEIESDAFDGIGRPIQISLTENRLQTLPRKVFEPLLDRLSKKNDGSFFNLRDNPFVCDCRMRWLLENRDYFKLLTNLNCFDTEKALDLYSLEDLGHC